MGTKGASGAAPLQPFGWVARNVSESLHNAENRDQKIVTHADTLSQLTSRNVNIYLIIFHANTYKLFSYLAGTSHFAILHGTGWYDPPRV